MEAAMGALLYGSPPSEIEIEDRLLTHLQVVVVQKLRRNESFLLSWEDPKANGAERLSVWMHPAIPLQFRFVGGRRPPINPTWLEEMARSSMTVEGLHLTPEPSANTKPPTQSTPLLRTERL
jgi:hypothetical protein